MFEELLDSAASAADSQVLHTTAESSHISSATGKAYRALKELVKAAHPRSGWRTPTDSLSVPACCFVQVEVQCEDPNLMQCGLEKCVAVDGSVEWVSAHSKVRLVSLSLSLTPFRSLTPDRSPIPQDRFMREGAKSLIWNQHSLGRTSDLSAPKDSPGSLEA